MFTTQLESCFWHGCASQTHTLLHKQSDIPHSRWSLYTSVASSDKSRANQGGSLDLSHSVHPPQTLGSPPPSDLLPGSSMFARESERERESAGEKKKFCHLLTSVQALSREWGQYHMRLRCMELSSVIPTLWLQS